MKEVVIDVVAWDMEFLDKHRIEALIAKTLPVLFFDEPSFHEYHRRNCEQLYRLIVTKGQDPLGFCYLGLRGGELRLGYSAPFSNIYRTSKSTVEDTALIAKALVALAEKLEKNLRLTLPPVIYDEELPLKMGALLDAGFGLEYAHLNSHFELQQISSMEAFASDRSHSYRKNLKRGKTAGLQFYADKGQTDLLDKAYRVIAANRKQKGYPLAMSYEQIRQIAGMRTASGIHSPVESFVVTSTDTGEIMASAIVFIVSDKVAQVIYWGSLEEYNASRPMEFLSYHLVEYYRQKDLTALDVGPVTVGGKISYGLLSFKDNIGCQRSLKPVMTYRVK